MPPEPLTSSNAIARLPVSFASDKTTPQTPRRRRQFAAAAVMLGLLAGAAICESLGWPFLEMPLERLLSLALDRRARFSGHPELDELRSNDFQVRFGGGIRLHAPQLEIGAPAWSLASHMLLGHDVDVELRYVDLWRAFRGQQLRVHRLTAGMLDGYIERQVDGRASWHFASKPESAESSVQPMPIPSFGDLQISTGTLRYRDAPLLIDIGVRISRTNGALLAVAPQLPSVRTVSAIVQAASGLQVSAGGHYRGLPLNLELLAQGALPWVANPASTVPVPLTLNVSVGRTSLVFKGTTLDAGHQSGLTGRFRMTGPSLAAVGDAVGVTLPSTSAFRTVGAIAKQGDVWRVVVDDATVGGSRLNGVFAYETGRSVPLLSGRLGGRLMLVDLGPMVGMTPTAATLNKAPSSSARASSAKAEAKVLPDRYFDLATLRDMDADVLIDISSVDLGTSLLEPLRALSGRLQLDGGVLVLRELNARLGQGRLVGDLQLDGRGKTALWNANLRWDGVRLEKWIRQKRADTSPPSVSGRMKGQAILAGQGRSTAEILASLKGQVRTELRDGAVSHFFVEVAGLDLAQGLGVLLRGNDFLPVQCAVADLVADDGVFRPRVMVLDTANSAVWIDGSLSLATEALDLRAVVMPKSFSPLTLRTPLRVRGTLAHPEVSLEKGPMGLKLAAAFLLALVNPLAALIPLIDTGDADDANRSAAGCYGLTQQSTIKLAAAAQVR